MTRRVLRPHKQVEIDTVTPHPDNYRRGNVDRIAASLEENGQYRPIVVQASTGYICAGNHTWKAAKQLGWKRIAASLLDIDDLDDARNLEGVTPGSADLIFTCPPYYDTEVYDPDNPDDLSTLPTAEFDDAFARSLIAAERALADDRFAVYVLGGSRDRKGWRDLPSFASAASAAAGFTLHNHAIYITPAGAIPIRAGRGFQRTRVLASHHQHVLVFVKGSPKKATEAIGPVEVRDLDDVDAP